MIPPRDERADLLALAAEWRDATPEARDHAIWSACATAAAILDGRPDREAALAYQDPVPRDTLALMARLREEYRARRQRERG